MFQRTSPLTFPSASACFHSARRNCCLSTPGDFDGIHRRKGVSTPQGGIAVFQPSNSQSLPRSRACFHSARRNCCVSTFAIIVGACIMGWFPLRKAELLCFNGGEVCQPGNPVRVSTPQGGIAVFQPGGIKNEKASFL